MCDAVTTPPRQEGAASTSGAGTRIFKGGLIRIREGRAWAFTEEPPPQLRRPAQVAQALAREDRLQAAIDRGDHVDRADSARQLGFMRARITQILNLLQLAPELQESALQFEAVDGVEPLSERALRYVVRHACWGEQRRTWTKLQGAQEAS